MPRSKGANLKSVEEAHDRGVVEAVLRLFLLEQVVDAFFLLGGCAFAALFERVLVPEGSKAVGLGSGPDGRPEPEGGPPCALEPFDHAAYSLLLLPAAPSSTRQTEAN